MVRLFFACASLMIGEPGPPPAKAADLREYREAVAHAGRDADAQVRLALWCEAHGMPAERVRHLTLAVLADPRNAAARGLMGMVSDGGRWRKPEAVAERAKADAELGPLLAEYNAKREKTPDTPDAQWKLALWCDEHGLKAEAMAHFTAVTRLDPRREAAWQRLGCKKHKGRWMTDAQVAAERSEAQAQQKADRRYKALFEKWKATPASSAKRDEVERAMAALTDPRAVPSIWRVFAGGKAADQARAAQLLGQIQAPTATQGLAMLAIVGDSPEVRKAAMETLRRRDAREYLGPLIALLRDPLKYRVKPVDGPGSTGVLLVEGEGAFIRRDYTLPLAASIPRLFDNSLSYDPTYGAVAVGIPVLPAANPAVGQLAEQLRANPGQAVDLIGQAARANGGAPQPGFGFGFGFGITLEDIVQQQALQDQLVRQHVAAIERSTLMARQQMFNDVAAVEATNRVIREDNAKVVDVLKAVTGQEFGDDRESWKAWWTDQQGYSYSPPRPKPKPVVHEVAEVGVDYSLTPPPALAIPGPMQSQRSCFAAGTPVRTLSGFRPIESIRVGDRLLTQNTTTGALTFQPALVVYHNPPSATLRIDLGGGAPIVTTGIHRFWVAGGGWKMARDLKPGDPVRILGGVARVMSVEPAGVQPVFNLVVAESRNFFAGTPGALVHDNSLVRPVSEPFDAPTAQSESGR